MKKVTIIAFLTLYLLSIVGLSVNVHHCAGQNSYEIFGININNDCECQHQDKNHTSSCCHNEQVVIKAIEKNQIKSNFSLVKNNWSLISPSFLPFNCEINKSTNIIQKVVKPEYPPRYSPPIYILKRVFLI